MHTFLRQFLLSILLCSSLSFGQTAGSPPADKERFHIYLLMGQSNMAGRDTRQLDKQVDDHRVLAMTPDGRWLVARDPIHQKDGRIEPGAGPGIPFALEMRRADPSATIGLVPCAVGGTPMKRWIKGGDLYQRALGRARLASEAGTIAGVLWLQGETDATKEPWANAYQARLSSMIRDLRKDLGKADLPVVVGQIGGFLSEKRQPYADTVRTAIRKVAGEVPHVGYADSKGLDDKGDSLHFSAKAQHEFGIRFAHAMRVMAPESANDNATNVPGAAMAVNVWPTDRMPGKPARETETRHEPERNDAIRVTNVSHPTLSMFPAKGDKRPAVIVCPGGGYRYTVVDKEGSEIAAWLNSRGITAFVLKYRSPHNREGALQDLQRSIRLVRENADAWHIDGSRIGVIGFSAGGHLATMASNGFAKSSYQPVDSADKQSPRPDFAILVYPAYLDDGKGALSKGLDPSADIPPTLIVHSDDDERFILGSTLYDAALTRAGKPHKFLRYASGGHGYGLHCQREAKAWPQDAAAWLEKLGM
ncbi:MAG: alpha/beta hydrolase fold domain-containing protein, partial [Verrucomicrobiae bacterium]|nr:alpha/beta hydrolase fold domain-containing protein [Verrucomicrobiae bacterium]